MLEFNPSQLMKILDLTSDRVVAAAQRGVEKALEELAQDSEKLAPKDKGNLVRSKQVKVEVKNGLRVTGQISYSAIRKSKSGWEFDYAIYLHELSDFDPTTPGTGPKFLERPLKARYRRYQKIIADEIKGEFGRV
ncbi:HK97 gp10 family phage protein [Paenibacillus lutimineralis]|uniref:HK97 gp10 family phage protein n=1 Tax=Paenibacillus lutimineralis TaxID=2707005 RepID=A0A3S9V4A8_9BACL|nr:HK97 gp10 family phage protein [Paenibacillus lutimineralis]AZS17393.1 HK97 gp10 family phage protein [Paenibacillus lutimineralis]